MNKHQETARTLLSKMTIEEKAAQLYSIWLQLEGDGTWSLRKAKSSFIKKTQDDPTEIIRNGIGQITRPLGTRPADPLDCVRGLNAVQEFLVKRTRLGIPALTHEECLPGLMARGSTQMPAAINYGASWDPRLMQKLAKAIGDELVAVGSRQALSPVLDVSRDARWGRTEETFGEDPYLVGQMAIAYVRGIQGTNDGGPETRAFATLKHYVGHSFSEGGRNHAPVRVGERELNDVFLLPFEMAVKLSGVGSVMPAYHDIDGEPSSSSVHYMKEVLRDRWGFNGIIVSDYEAVRFLTDHHAVAGDYAEATALALKAGMDQELPSYNCYRTGIPQALDRGILAVEDVNAAVLNVLEAKSRLGLFENPYADEGAVKLNTPEHKAVAREMACKSIVMLSNDGLLPLAGSEKTALIGPLADDPMAVFCGYSFPTHLIAAIRSVDTSIKYAKTLREVLAERPETGELIYARGCDVLSERPVDSPVFPGDAEDGSSQIKVPVSEDTSGFAEAIDAARVADRVVMAVGDLAGLFLTGTVGEGSDATSLRLPGVQQELLDAVLELGKPTVIVQLSGRPYHLGDAFDRAGAVLNAWLPGQEGMEAIADVLFGHEEPGGRLPVSIPRDAGAMPYFYNHKMKSPGAPIQPMFGATYPFGHGIGYTTFAYSGLKLSSLSVPIDGTVELEFNLTNTGQRPGDEVVQLYVRDTIASLVRPLKELKGFKRVTVDPGKSARIRVRLPVDMLGFTKNGEDRVVEPGEFRLMIGSSSEDIHLETTVTVAGTARMLPEDWRMVSEVEPLV